MNKSQGNFHFTIIQGLFTENIDNKTTPNTQLVLPSSSSASHNKTTCYLGGFRFVPPEYIAQRRWLHTWHATADRAFIYVHLSHAQLPKSSAFLTDVPVLEDPFPLPPLLLLVPAAVFELILLHTACESTSESPFSSALTRFSK